MNYRTPLKFHFATKKGWINMLDFTWSIFKETGNIDTYLLFKEIQMENQEPFEISDNEVLTDMNFPIL